MSNRVSAHAVRLVANCIIAYNGIILNAIYEKMLKDRVSQDIIDEFLGFRPLRGRTSLSQENTVLKKVMVKLILKRWSKH